MIIKIDEKDPQPEWVNLPPKDAAKAYLQTLAKDPAWKADGFMPIIVVENRDGKRVIHPFIFDLAKTFAN